jgi:hypothetical protein
MEQMALRRMLEAMVTRSEGSLQYRVEDRFWESANGRSAVYGWGTAVRAVSRPTRAVQVWFDGLDQDVCVTSKPKGGRRLWSEWRDLTDLDRVLREVHDEVLRQLRIIGGEAS